MKEKGYGYQTISNHKRSLNASFHIAIADDLVRKNPFDFKLNEVIEDTESHDRHSQRNRKKNCCLLSAKTGYIKNIMTQS